MVRGINDEHACVLIREFSTQKKNIQKYPGCNYSEEK